jgi:hypothetical protein
VSVQEFRDDDSGYLRWVSVNPRGFVINIRRNLNPIDARTHHASCRTISGENPRAGPWTGMYIKLCSADVGALDQWATEHLSGPITGCRVCESQSNPNSRRAAPSTNQHKTAVSRSSTLSAPARPGEIRGPTADQPSISVWADDYIRFERRPVWQEALRKDIRAKLRRIEASPGQVLHATFFGQKHPAADVENLLLYNIDDTGASFAGATRRGLRFEVGGRVPASPTGDQYRYGYRYELMSRSGDFRNWHEGCELVSWDWIDLGAFSGPKKLEQVWLAIVRSGVRCASPSRSPGTPFAVRTTIRAPHGATLTLGYLIKGIIDGVVCAFQALTDISTVTELALRVSGLLCAPAAEIEAHLLNQEKAVLGSVPRLLHGRSKGVIWAPDDSLCLAGELLAEQPSTSTWAIKGRIVELVPAAGAHTNQ